MKNVVFVPNRVMQIPIPGAPPLRGWAVRYESGIDDAAYKPGFWLIHWQPTPTGTANLNFGPGQTMCFLEESVANHVADTLRNHCEIETTVVKVG